MRRLALSTSAILVLLSTLAVAVAAAAPDEKEVRPAAEPASGTGPQLHRRIYVPLEQWEEVIAEEPRGLMLTRQEYDDLMQRARRARDLVDPERRAPVGAVISTATYRASIVGDRCAVTATLALDFVREGWLALPLGLQGTAPSRATLDGEAALIHPGPGGGFELLAKGEGRSELVIEFSTRAHETADGRLVRFGLAPAAAGRLILEMPGEWDVSEEAGAGERVVADAEGGGETTTFSTPVGGRDGVVLHVSPARRGTERRPVILLEKDLSVLVDEAGVDARWALAFTVLREKRSSFDLDLPEGLDLADVQAENLLDWRILDDGNLRLSFQREMEGRLPISIRMKGARPAGAEVTLPEIRGVDVDREWGRMQIDLGGGLRGRLVRSADVREVPPEQGAAAVFRAFAWAGSGRVVTIAVERPPVRLHADVRTLLQVSDRGISFLSKILYTALEGETLTLQPVLPPGLDLDSVEHRGIPLEWREEEGGRVWVNLASKLAENGRVALAFSGRIPKADEVAIPRVVAGAAVEEGYIALAVEGGYSLLGRDIAGLDPIDARLTSDFLGMHVPGARLCYRYRDTDFRGRVLVREETPEIVLDTVHYVTVGEESLEHAIRLTYEVRRAGVEEVRFHLPKGTGEIEIDAVGIKQTSRTEGEEFDEWMVTFQSPLLGTRDIFVTFDSPVGKMARRIPEIVGMGVARQRGALAIEASEDSEIGLEVRRGLRDIDPAEVPEHGRYRPERKVLAAYSYATSDHALAIRATRHERGEVGDAIVADLRATLQVNDWGEEKVVVEMDIRETTLQRLVFELPPGASLWAAELDGVGVKPAEMDGKLVIPLEGKGAEEKRLKLLYSTGRRSGMAVASSLPTVAYPVRMTRVWMHVPDERMVLWAGGTIPPTFEVPGRSVLRALWESRKGYVLVLLALGALTALGMRFRESIAEQWYVTRLRYGRKPVWIGVTIVVVAIGGFLWMQSSVEMRSASNPALRASTGAGAAAPATSESLDTLERGLAYGEPQSGGGFHKGLSREHLEGEAAPPIAAYERPPAPEVDESPYDLAGEEDRKDIHLVVPMEKKADEGRGRFGWDVDKDAVRVGDQLALGGKPFGDPGAPRGGVAAGEPAGQGPGGTGGQPGRSSQAFYQRGYLGGLDLQGLASLEVDYPQTGRTYFFQRQGKGGEARLMTLGLGGIRTLAILAFLGGIFGTLLAVRRRALVPVALLVVIASAIPEVVAGLAVPANAAVAGVALAAALASLHALVVRFGAARPGGAVAVGLLLLATLAAPPALAQEVGADDVPPSPDEASRLLEEWLREAGELPSVEMHRVFIPYDPTDPAALDEENKIYVPYDEYRRLWNLAYPGLAGLARAPVPFAVRSATYRATLEGKVLSATATFDLRSFERGWTEIPLGLKGARIRGVTVNGAEGGLRESEAGFLFLAEAAGSYRIEVDFETEGTSRGGVGALVLDLSGTPVSSLLLTVADAERRVRILGAPAGQWKENGHVRADLGGADEVRISWESGVGVGAEVARRAESRAVFRLGEGFVSLRQLTVFEVSGGKSDTFRFRIDDGFRVHGVHGNGVRTWGIEDGALVVGLFQPREGKVALTIHGERDYDDGKTPLPVVAPEGVESDRGQVLVTADAYLRGRVTRADGVRRISAGDWTGPAAEADVIQAYGFVARPIALEAEVDLREAAVSADVMQTVAVREREISIRLEAQEQIRDGAIFERTLKAAPGYQLDGFSTADGWIEDDGTIHLIFAEGRSGSVGYSIRLSRRFREPQTGHDLPSIWIDGVERQKGVIGVRSEEGFRLVTADLDGLRSVDPRLSGLSPAPDIALRYSRAYSGRLRLVKDEATLSASFTTHVEAVGENLEVATRIVYRSERGASDTLTFALPATEAEADVRVVGEALRERESRIEGDRRIWTVTLQAPFRGDYALRVYIDKKFEGGRPLAVPVFTFPGVEERDGTILIQAGESLSGIEDAVVEGLQGVPVRQVAELPPGVEPNQILRAYRTVKEGWRLELAMKDLDSRGRGEQVLIKYLSMETVVQEDGLSWNRATYWMRNRELQLLRLRLPAGAELLSLFVDELPSRPSMEGSDYLVPLPRASDGDSDFGVELVYTIPLGRPGAIGSVEPLSPELKSDVRMSRVLWTLRVPDSMQALSFGGDMDEVGEAIVRTVIAEEAAQEEARLLEQTKSGSQAQRLRAKMNLAKVQQRAQHAWQAAEVAQKQAERTEQQNDADLLSNRRVLLKLQQDRARFKSEVDKAALEGQTILGNFDEPGLQQGGQGQGAYQEEVLKKALEQAVQRKSKNLDKWEGDKGMAGQADGPVQAETKEFTFDPENRGLLDELGTRDATRFWGLGDLDGGEDGGVADRRGALRDGEEAELGEELARARPGRAAYRQPGLPGAEPVDDGIREVAALSVRVDLPEGGREYHFSKEGAEARLHFRAARRSWGHAGGAGLRLLALAGIFVAALRLGWVRREDLSTPGGGMRALVLLVAVGALLANSAVALAILLIVALLWWRTRG